MVEVRVIEERHLKGDSVGQVSASRAAKRACLLKCVRFQNTLFELLVIIIRLYAVLIGMAEGGQCNESFKTLPPLLTNGTAPKDIQSD